MLNLLLIGGFITLPILALDLATQRVSHEHVRHIRVRAKVIHQRLRRKHPRRPMPESPWVSEDDYRREP